MSLFIICHNGLPSYRPPEGAIIMWMSASPAPAAGDTTVVPGYQFFDAPEQLHDKLSGTFGSLAIHRYLVSQGVTAGSVTIWQYRKFLSPASLGRASPNYPGMRLITTAEAAGITPDLPNGHQAEYVLSRALKISGLAHQYMLSHNVIDLLRYSALAIETGVLEQKRTTAFLNEALIFPGGLEFGTYPAAWWMDAFERLSRPALAFAERYEPFMPDNPYQRRAIAFCQERLGSHLLLGHLRAEQSVERDRVVFGSMHTVTDDDRYRGGRS